MRGIGDRDVDGGLEIDILKGLVVEMLRGIGERHREGDRGKKF